MLWLLLVFANLNATSQTSGKLDSRFTNDGLHLTGAGYQHWKQFLLDNKFL